MSCFFPQGAFAFFVPGWPAALVSLVLSRTPQFCQLHLKSIKAGMNSANRGLIGFSFVPGLQVVLLYVTGSLVRR